MKHAKYFFFHTFTFTDNLIITHEFWAHSAFHFSTFNTRWWSIRPGLDARHQALLNMWVKDYNRRVAVVLNGQNLLHKIQLKPNTVYWTCDYMQFLSVATMKKMIVSHLEFLQLWSANNIFEVHVDDQFCGTKISMLSFFLSFI